MKVSPTEAKRIAEDAMVHDGWLDPVDMMALAQAYLDLLEVLGDLGRYLEDVTESPEQGS